VAAVIVTGDELIPPESRPAPGEIRDANTHSISAALMAMGLDPPRRLYARDRAEDVRACFAGALEEADVVISVGGVSVGKYDFVKPALEALGVETLFWRVAMKPGKPNYFGKKDGTLVFGLPGNTVSALISFHLLVRPAIRKMQGNDPRARNTFRARLDADLDKKSNRLELVRGCAFRDAHREWRVSPVKGRGSHMLGNLARANCIIYFPKEASHLPGGEWVEVEFLRWNEL
jgi:molybdopterin molybdotransferase